MGWFLQSGSRKRKTGGRRSGAGSVQRKPWDPQRTLAGLKVLGVVVAVAGAVVGWRYGEQALRGYVTQQSTVSPASLEIHLVDAPPWMSPSLREQLVAVVRQRVSADPLDRRGLELAAWWLDQDAWVQHVQRVERGPGGRVEVHASYREPIAVIEARDGYHLVDAVGVRLPQLYRRDEVRALGLPLLVGAAAAPPLAGERWQGADVEAGLKLARLLRGEAYMDQVRAVDIGQRDDFGRIRLVLLTDRGMVRWGLPPGDERAIEPDAITKKRWLEQVHAHYGSIDNNGQVVDVFRAAVWQHEDRR